MIPLIFGLLLSSVAGSFTIDQLEPRQVIYHRFDVYSSSTYLDAVLVTLTPEGEIEFFKGEYPGLMRLFNKPLLTKLSFLSYFSIMSYSYTPHTDQMNESEIEYIRTAIRDGRIVPQPIMDHQILMPTYNGDREVTVARFINLQYTDSKVIDLERAVAWEVTKPSIHAILRRDSMIGLTQWENPQQYSVVSHYIREMTRQTGRMESVIILLDKSTNKPIRISRPLDRADTPYKLDGFVQMGSHFGPLGISLAANRPKWPNFEIDRGNHILKPIGEQSIVFLGKNNFVSVLTPLETRTYSSRADLATDPDVGAVTSFIYRIECFRTFAGLVDSASEEIMIHIINDHSGIQSVLVRNYLTNKYRWIKKDSGIVRSIWNLFDPQPEWVSSEADASTVSRMEELMRTRHWVPSSLAESRVHPVVQIIDANGKAIVHSVDSSLPIIIPQFPIH